MPANQGYTDEELLSLTQNAFPEFDQFEQSQNEVMGFNADLNPETNPVPEGPPIEGLPGEGAPELPQLIQSIAGISPEIIEAAPLDVKLEAIKMLIG